MTKATKEPQNSITSKGVSMPVADNDKRNELLKVLEPAQNHVDVFVSATPPIDNKSTVKGIGSAVHLHYNGRNFTVTCSHVAKEQCIYFAGPPRLPKPLIENEPVRISNLKLITRCKEVDIAILDGVSELSPKKARYDIGKSKNVTEALLSKHLGLAGYIYGTWGDEYRAISYEDGIWYGDLLVYTALGNIKAVQEKLILGDFTEKESLPLPPSKINCEPTEATGGSRDISGCSGCGLWINCGDEVTLAGILLGAEVASAKEHIIRFTPVWTLLKMLNSSSIEGS